MISRPEDLQKILAQENERARRRAELINTWGGIAWTTLLVAAVVFAAYMLPR